MSENNRRINTASHSITRGLITLQNNAGVLFQAFNCLLLITIIAILVKLSGAIELAASLPCRRSSIAPAVSGDSTYNTAVNQFGGRELIATNSYNNAIVGAAVQDGANGPSFPTGVTGYGYLNNVGNTVFGLFGRADCYSAGACVNEMDAFNYAGAPYSSFPPDESFGTTQILPIALQFAAYGNYSSYALLYAAPTSVGTQGAILGLYLGAGVANYGVVVDATSSAGPGAAATFNTTGGASTSNLVMQMKGTPASGAQFISAYNSGGGELFSVDGNGNVIGAGFKAGSSTGVSCAGTPTSFFAAVGGIVTHC